MLIVLLLVILASAVACLWNRGIWTASLALINTVLAALLAMNYFEPLANKLGSPKSNMMDFLCLWGLFAVFFFVMRLATDLVSRMHSAISVCARHDWRRAVGDLDRLGTVLVHAGEPARRRSRRSPFLGSFMETPDQKMVGVGPDRIWLAFTRSASLGAFSNGEEGFDPKGEFIYKYAARRKLQKPKQ